MHSKTALAIDDISSQNTPGGPRETEKRVTDVWLQVL